MANKFRQMAQQLKERVNSMPQLLQSKDKVDQLLTKYKTGTKVSELAEKFKQDSLGRKVKELVSKYEKFTGVEEIMAIQNTVIDAQERFIGAQDRRRDLGRELATIEARLKELHAEMQNTMKGDEKYLQLCTEEHKLIVQERALRTVFAEAEREERELFASMSAAVKLGHERERAHAERNKYWYIVASIFGTVLGIAGSTINNRLKMAEFRDMMEQQMAKSASVMYTIAGGRAAPATDISEAMRTEFAYQEQLAQNLRVMQENINHLVNKQSTLVEHLNHQEHNLDKHMRDLKRIIVAASQSSAKSDAALAHALSEVHHDLDDVDKHKDVPTPIDQVVMNQKQVLTGISIVMALAMIFGAMVGRTS